MYDDRTTDNAALLTAAFLKWHDIDPERLHIRDVMTLRGKDENDGLPYENRQFQATVKGMTDWYSFKIDRNGRPVPASIRRLPF